jgi:hypothetical protein
VAEAFAELDAIGLRGSEYKAEMGNGVDTIYGKASINEQTSAFVEAFASAYAQARGAAEEAEAEAEASDPEAADATAEASATDAFVLRRRPPRPPIVISRARADAEAVAEAVAEAETTAIGIEGGVYDLGNGADVVHAVAEGADCNIGVLDVVIYGGNGADKFLLQSGTGEVIGGKGEDLLALEGENTDYMFEMDGDWLNITGGIQPVECIQTDLLVKEVELFQFDNGIFSAAQIESMIA